MQTMTLQLNKVWNADCLAGMRAHLPDECVDVVVTSPPYADRRISVYGGQTEEEYVRWFMPIAAEIKRVLKPSGSFFLNMKPHTQDGERVLYVWELIMSMKYELDFMLIDEFCWTRNSMPGFWGGRFKNGFEPVYHLTKSKEYKFRPQNVRLRMKEPRASGRLARVSGNGSGMSSGNSIAPDGMALPSNHLHIEHGITQHSLASKHPAVFPVKLPEFFIRAFADEGDLVLDPFLGSGSTAIAAIRAKRNYVGFESVLQYAQLATVRIALEAGNAT